MEEIWKELIGNSVVYLVSNMGNIKTKPRKGKYHFIESHPMKVHTKEDGYQRVMLSLDENGGKYYYIHRIVAKLFIPNPNNLQFVNHKDGNKSNNCADNLEWCTRSENEKHAWRIGLKNSETCGTKGEKHGMHKLTEEQVKYIRQVHTPFDSLYGTKGLAKQFNVSPQTITNVVHYANWKCV